MIRATMLIFIGFTVTAAVAAKPVSFRRDIAPILESHCLSCHGPKTAEGGYRVDTYEQLFKPGDSDLMPISTDADAKSELLRRLTCDESERMPAETDPLSREKIALIKTWIESGAKFDGESESAPLSKVIPPRDYPPALKSYREALPITAICFSPDRKSLIVGGYHELTVWEVETGTLIRRIENVGQRTYSIRLSNDATLVSAAGGEPGRSGEVRLVDWSSGEIKSVVARCDGVVLDSVFHPNGKTLAAASADRSIQIIDLKSSKRVRAIASHADSVTALAFSPDGSRLISASQDKSAKVFDASSGQLLGSYTAHGAAVRGVSVASDGKHAYSTGDDNKIHRWTIENTKRLTAVPCGESPFKLFQQGDSIFFPSVDGIVRQLNTKNNKFSQQFTGHTDWAISVAVDKDAQRVAAGGIDGQIRVWKLADGTLLNSWLAKP